MRARSAVLAGCLALGACAQQPVQQPEKPAAQAAPVAAEPKPKVVVARRAPTRQPPLPNVPLTEPIMFKMMLAEVAVQRGQMHIAVPAYLELTRETRDPRIAQRATELAWNARMVTAALEAAGIWLQVDPESPQARQVLAALLVNQSQLAEALPHLEKWLAADPNETAQGFLQLSSLLSRNKDREGVLQLIQALAKPYPKMPEARLAVAQAAANAGNQELAIGEASAALALRPDWELAALFRAQSLATRSNTEALTSLADYLKQYPKAKDVRLTYARLLVAEKRFPEARKQFDQLLKEFPGNTDVLTAVAMLALQANDFDSAEKHLQQMLDVDSAQQDVARYYLGQVNEERKRYDDALKWYGSVTGGEQYLLAQIRYAGVLAKQGKLNDARKHLAGLSPQSDQQRVQVVQAEAQMLRDANAYQDAYDVLSKALARMPDSADLLYDHAMAAEKLNRIDVLEKNLRRVIELRPDHAHAYNALGYTFADRNERLPEARALIDKATQLAPEDPFIMDSLGWVLYRQGELKEAIKVLRRAYSLRSDAEIAAHLGEVLWMDGQRDEAQKIWKGALAEHPTSDVLQNTIKRFAPRILPASR